MIRVGALKGSLVRGLFAWIASALAILVTTHSWAQSLPVPPQPVRTDENGVDVATRTLVVGQTDIAIGPGDHRGLRVDRQLSAFGWRISSTPIISGSVTKPVVVVDGQSRSFQGNGSDPYDPWIEDGTILSSNLGTFTLRDGTVIEFQNVTGLSEHPTAFKAAKKITFPDGVEHTFTYQTGQYQLTTSPATYETVTRLISVNSSTGYQIKFGYVSNTAASYSWRRLNKLTSINNAVEYCSPTTNTCSLAGDWPQVTYGSAGLAATPTVTDPENRVTTYTYSGSKLTSITPPGQSPMSFTYNGNEVVTASRGGGTWTYTPQYLKTDVTDPNNRTTTYSFTAANLITAVKDAKGQITSFRYCYGTPNCPWDVLNRVTFPEGNYVTYTYDARANVVSTAYREKPTVGTTTLTQTASFRQRAPVQRRATSQSAPRIQKAR